MAVAWGGPGALSDGPRPFSQLSGTALAGQPGLGGQGLCTSARRPHLPKGRKAASLGKARAAKQVPLEGGGHHGAGRQGRPLQGSQHQHVSKTSDKNLGQSRCMFLTHQHF